MKKDDIKNKIISYHKADNSEFALVTIAIGEKYRKSWETYSKDNWIQYCKRYNINLYVVVEDLISKEHPKWKKATWQKLLLGNALKVFSPASKLICYIDTDFLISPLAPNVFNSYTDHSSIGLVSQVKNLPYDLNMIKRVISYGRHNYYNQNYPLDSAIFMQPEDIFAYHGFPIFDDYACAGFFVFAVNNHSEMMYKWFFEVETNYDSLTGGDEPFFNSLVQSWGKIAWLPYKFHALWIYEMAGKYPFLYINQAENSQHVVECIKSSLMQNHFLHFAGSWGESEMIKDFCRQTNFPFFEDGFKQYLNTAVTGSPKGMIRP
ncbi:hypothetical protein OAI64_02480 [Schleiferiaceae bacterium]|nr:hypothetical protein [Schleiferiaceae bacterium]